MEKRKFNFKEAILGIFAAFFGIAAFWLWRGAVAFAAEGGFENYAVFFAPYAVLLCAAVFFGLSALFIQNKSVVYASAVAVAGVPYFFMPAAGIVPAAMLISVFLTVLAVYRARKENELSSGFSVPKLLKGCLPLYFTAASLVVSVFFFARMDEKKAFAAFLPKPVVEGTLDYFSESIGSLAGLPRFDSGETVDEALLGLVEEQLKERGVSAAQMPKNELNRLLAFQREEIGKNLGLRLAGKEKISDVFYEAASARFEGALGSYKRYLPYASAAAFFFAFKAATFPLYYLSLFAAFLLIKLMLAVKILRNEKTVKEMEKPVLT